MDTGVGMETVQQRMEREAKEKADADAANQESLPPPMRPLMEQNFMQCMQMMQETQNKFMEELLGQANQRAPEGGGVSLSDFQNARLLPFASAPEPMDAEDWLADTKRKLKTVGCNDEEKLRYATHLLTGPATSWWENQLAMQQPGREFTWEEFKQRFREYHVPESVMELKRREFEELQQGYTSVMKYIREFSQLSRYAEEDVNTEEKRKKRFLCGLNPFVKMQLRLSNKQTYQQLMDAAITFEDDYKNVQEDRRKRAKKETKRIQASKTKPNLEFKPWNRNYGNNNNNKGSGGNQSNPRRNVICNNCGIPGHFQRECKKH